MPGLDEDFNMDSSNSKMVIEFGIARRVERPWEEFMQPVKVSECLRGQEEDKLSEVCNIDTEMIAGVDDLSELHAKSLVYGQSEDEPHMINQSENVSHLQHKSEQAFVSDINESCCEESRKMESGVAISCDDPTASKNISTSFLEDCSTKKDLEKCLQEWSEDLEENETKQYQFETGRHGDKLESGDSKPSENLSSMSDLETSGLESWSEMDSREQILCDEDKSLNSESANSDSEISFMQQESGFSESDKLSALHVDLNAANTEVVGDGIKKLLQEDKSETSSCEHEDSGNYLIMEEGLKQSKNGNFDHFATGISDFEEVTSNVGDLEYSAKDVLDFEDSVEDVHDFEDSVEDVHDFEHSTVDVSDFDSFIDAEPNITSQFRSLQTIPEVDIVYEDNKTETTETVSEPETSSFGDEDGAEKPHLSVCTKYKEDHIGSQYEPVLENTESIFCLENVSLEKDDEIRHDDDDAVKLETWGDDLGESLNETAYLGKDLASDFSDTGDKRKNIEDDPEISDEYSDENDLDYAEDKYVVTCEIFLSGKKTKNSISKSPASQVSTDTSVKGRFGRNISKSVVHSQKSDVMDSIINMKTDANSSVKTTNGGLFDTVHEYKQQKERKKDIRAEEKEVGSNFHIISEQEHLTQENYDIVWCDQSSSAGSVCKNTEDKVSQNVSDGTQIVPEKFFVSDLGQVREKVNNLEEGKRKLSSDSLYEEDKVSHESAAEKMTIKDAATDQHRTKKIKQYYRFDFFQKPTSVSQRTDQNTEKQSKKIDKCPEKELSVVGPTYADSVSSGVSGEHCKANFNTEKRQEPNAQVFGHNIVENLKRRLFKSSLEGVSKKTNSDKSHRRINAVRETKPEHYSMDAGRTEIPTLTNISRVKTDDKSENRSFRDIKSIFEKQQNILYPSQENGHHSTKHSSGILFSKVTYRSTTSISLSPSTQTLPDPSQPSHVFQSQNTPLSLSEDRTEEEVIQDGRVISRSKEEKRYSESSFGGPTEGIFVGVETNTSPPYMGGGHYQENGFDAGPHDPNIAKETQAKEDFHFSEMSSVRRSFEDGSQDASTSHGQHTEDVQWDEDEEGVFENKPVVRSDVARESDRNIGVELPEVGMAKHMLNRFTKLQSEPGEVKKREITPPNTVAGRVEFVSEPTTVTERYEGKAEAGVFENEPAHNPNIVRSGEEIHEELPERGMARNVAEKFKRLESSSGSAAPPSPTKREITPDRATGKVEFVSEPRGHVEKYEGKAEAGVFESTPHSHEGVVKSGEEIEEELPERGYAKNIAAKFKQMGSGPTPTPRGKRDITPDKHTRGEYVSEPRTQVERYEGKAEAGVFENCPNQRPDVIKSDEVISEEPLPERGYTKNIAAKFREWESTAKSPPPTPNRTKEFTPPREDRNLKQSSGVYESHPEEKADVAKETVHLEETLPERGTARNLVSRFRQLEEESSRVQTSSRGVIEITPPRAESGVFENQPNQFTPEYSQKAESGILESQPVHRDDVVKESDPVRYEEELPERGAAKNLVSKWRQIESESAKHSPPSGQRQKEFTPPRDEERVKQARSPRTPVSPSGHAQSVQPEDLPGQYQQSHEPAVFESSPVHRDDCIREADTDWTEGMPKSNTTKKMLAKFKNIQAEAYKEPPKPISRKEEGDRQTPDKETKAKKSGFFVAVQTEKCGACQKTVYAMEKLEMNNTIYHKTCFKCSQCKSRLTPKTFAVNNGVIFCTNHYKQLFARKGNYDEGFGREQYKKKWRSEPNLTESEPEDATT